MRPIERRNDGEDCYDLRMDEGRKRVIGIMAAILASLHMRTADDLFGTPPGQPANGPVDSGVGAMGAVDSGEGGPGL